MSTNRPLFLWLSLVMLLAGCTMSTVPAPTPTATPAQTYSPQPTTTSAADSLATYTDEVPLPAVAEGLAAVAYKSKRSL